MDVAEDPGDVQEEDEFPHETDGDNATATDDRSIYGPE